MMAGLIQRGVVRISRMKLRFIDPHRREVLAGLGAAAASLIAGGAGPLVTAQLALQARASTLALRPGQPATPISELAAVSRLFEDGLKQPARPLPIIAAETGPVAVDHDEVLLIEEWRLRPDGSAVPPGRDPTNAAPLYTINGRTSFELSASVGQRLRLRFINGSQRSVLAIKLESHEVRVMALDGQPAEPFPARNGALVLAPGARADVFVDAATSAPFLLHDGRAARPIGNLAISGMLERAPRSPPASCARWPPGSAS